MSLLKLAALGAELLDILENHKDWNSDTFDIIQTRASLLGLADTDDEGMFKVSPEYKDAAFRLYEDFEASAERGQNLCLTMDAGEKTIELYPGSEIGSPSGVSILIKNRSYEL